MTTAALALLLSYLALFFAGGRMAARAAGRPVWLFGQARGRMRWAAAGFRASFVLALAGPVVLPGPALPVTGFAGMGLASAGAMLAFAAQMSMGASWRVGVAEGQTGALVTNGLFAFSRNPTFLGQAMLLAGAALATLSPLCLIGTALFLWSAQTQIRAEERLLQGAHGTAYQTWAATVPRWF